MTMTTRPDYENELDVQVRTRQIQFAAGVSKYLAGGAAVFAASVLIQWLFLPEYPQYLALAGMCVLAFAGPGLYFLFRQRGRPTMGIQFLILCFLLFVAALPVAIPEEMFTSFIGFICLSILGTLLLDPRRSRWVIWACVATATADVVFVRILAPEWFPPLSETNATTTVFFGIVAFVVGALAVRRVMIGQEEFFREAQRAKLEIERRVAAEQEQRQRLQATVQGYVEYMARVGRGDLAIRLSLDGDGQEADDPLLVLGNQLNETTASLNRTILQIHEAAGNVATAASEILAATTQQLSGAHEQSASISQTTTTVDEVKTIGEQSVERAQAVADMSQRTVEVSRTGQRAVQEIVESMAQIKERVEGIAENILALSEHTQQIGEIITTVNEIAAQSNMLALNASVEAARAGEHGKGFAVVASEVRSLAEQSKQATAQVRAILGEIQKATNTTVMATEEGTKAADLGVQLTEQAGETIRQLADVIDEAMQAAMQMVAGGRQQASGVEQIALAMTNINQATVQSLASTRQAEKAAQDLNGLAQGLTEMVARYQL